MIIKHIYEALNRRIEFRLENYENHDIPRENEHENAFFLPMNCP